MTVYCRDCDNVALQSRKDHPARWMCLKYRRAPGFSFVTPGEWVNFPPYLYCRELNTAGICPDFTPTRSPAGAPADTPTGADE